MSLGCKLEIGSRPEVPPTNIFRLVDDWIRRTTAKWCTLGFTIEVWIFSLKPSPEPSLETKPAFNDLDKIDVRMGYRLWMGVYRYEERLSCLVLRIAIWTFQNRFERTHGISCSALVYRCFLLNCYYLSDCVLGSQLFKPIRGAKM